MILHPPHLPAGKTVLNSRRISVLLWNRPNSNVNIDAAPLENTFYIKRGPDDCKDGWFTLQLRCFERYSTAFNVFSTWRSTLRTTSRAPVEEKKRVKWTYCCPGISHQSSPDFNYISQVPTGLSKYNTVIAWIWL